MCVATLVLFFPPSTATTLFSTHKASQKHLDHLPSLHTNAFSSCIRYLSTMSSSHNPKSSLRPTIFERNDQPSENTARQALARATRTRSLRNNYGLLYGDNAEDEGVGTDRWSLMIHDIQADPPQQQQSDARHSEVQRLDVYFEAWGARAVSVFCFFFFLCSACQRTFNPAIGR